MDLIRSGMEGARHGHISKCWCDPFKVHREKVAASSQSTLDEF